MRMVMPPVRIRRLIVRHLRMFFRDEREADCKAAVRLFADFYKIKPPRVVWFEHIDWGRIAGRTHEDGTIHMMHPSAWKRGRKYNSEDQYTATLLHELGHVIFYSDCERKADLFAERMEDGL